MSKAFDSVDHQILLRKIQRVGASTSALKWFNSYLTNRYQVVRIHSSVSDPLPVECCLPQGSILGPLLFSIYLNDLPEVPRQWSTECYVDDTKLFVSFNLHDTQRIVQEMNKAVLNSKRSNSVALLIVIFAIFTLPIMHLAINIVFAFPWNDCNIQNYAKGLG